MKKLVLLILATLLGILLTATLALAANIQCEEAGLCAGTEENDYINGTSADDLIYGLGGSDAIYGREGDDRVYGGRGSDIIFDVESGDIDNLFGSEGNDRISVQDGDSASDRVDCGKGRDDIVYVDTGVDTTVNCEKVRS